MANRFEIGQARLIQHFLAHGSIDIIYHKLVSGVDTVIPVKCWPGDYLFKIIDRDNQRMEWSDRDYLIPVVNLKVGSTLFEPTKGHWIEENFSGVIQQYELSAPEKETVWRYSDQQHTLYRIHTKRIK